ncbi:hypothetical protein QBC36DRAFT_293127, partial [Triangularia setosa]
MSAPAAAPGRRGNLALFHQLRKYLFFSAASKARRPIPRVTCGICRSPTDEITTPATPAELLCLRSQPANPESTCKPGIVLPCGHMFHADCWGPYPSSFEGNPVLCPACRLTLVFGQFPRKCEDLCEIYHLPDGDQVNWKRLIRRVPQTVQEHRIEQEALVPEGGQEEGRGKPFRLGNMCNEDRIVDATLLGDCIAEKRELDENVSLVDMMAYLTHDGWFDDEEIELAFPGWMEVVRNQEGARGVEGIKGEPGFGNEVRFVVGRLLELMRAEGYTWAGPPPPPPPRSSVGGGMALWQ